MKTDERQLVVRILSGHTEEYGYFLDRYGPRVFALVARLVPVQLDAEEITQDAFVRAFSALGTFDFRSEFSTWISRIAYNCAVQFLRKRKREVAVDIDEAQLACISDSMADEVLAADGDGRIVVLNRAIEMLPPDDRALLTLFYYEDRSISDIAYILSLKESNVAVRLYRVRKRLCVLIKRLENED
ncbi:MAG: RNA polymerase sigma factor [Bacteroides sp.]|nr:RNA polymerase sigma factor [Roseburia sp.]MCM1346364.1 RNA polymerase sigma factor [Bacteroides sp.]MCM1420399.1 RNA polymerase sigma factor [Bacteroides sp.]